MNSGTSKNVHGSLRLRESDDNKEAIMVAQGDS
jgi:hypothetical protein